MSQFPRTEVEIVAFAQLVAEGLTKNATDFPAPPMGQRIFRRGSRSQHHSNLKYAEAVVRKTPDKLSGTRLGAARGKAMRSRPGPPVDGGLTSVYQVQRKQASGAWEDAGLATTTEHRLSNQPRGVELTYRVIAVNKAGQGQPSAVVTAVL